MRITFSHLREMFASEQPMLMRWGYKFFQWIPHRDEREEYVANAIAICWKRLVRLWRRRLLLRDAIRVVYHWSLRTASSGKGIDGRKSLREPLSFAARLRDNRQLLHAGQGEDCEEFWAVRNLCDPSSRYPVAEWCAVSLDWQEFVATLTSEVKELLRLRMLGLSRRQMAERIGVGKNHLQKLLYRAFRDWCDCQGLDPAKHPAVRPGRSEDR